MDPLQAMNGCVGINQLRRITQNYADEKTNKWRPARNEFFALRELILAQVVCNSDLQTVACRRREHIEYTNHKFTKPTR
jgi:hypothetical protein